jgi:hypothetical protein
LLQIMVDRRTGYQRQNGDDLRRKGAVKKTTRRGLDRRVAFIMRVHQKKHP